MVLTLPAVRAIPNASHRRGRCTRRPTAQWIPDYSLPGLGKPNRKGEEVQSKSVGSSKGLARKWWDYGSPTASIGRPNMQLQLVTIPQVSPGSGDGGGGGGRHGGDDGGSGGGRRGGDDGGGDSMKGFTYIFSTLLLAGGLSAYIRKGSASSLLISLAVATLLLISASLMHHRSGTLLALGTCLVLAAVMGQRANSSRKVFPAGIISILSALMTAGYARSLA